MKKVLTAIVTFIFGVCLISATVATASAASVKKVTNFKASATPVAVTLTWKKASGAKGYEIQQKNGKKWKNVATIKKAKTTTYTVKKLKNGTTYQFRIRAVNGKKKSGYVSVKVKAGVQKITSVTATSTGLKSAKITWDKANVTGYEIQQKNGKKWKTVKKIKKAKTTSVSVSKLAAGAQSTFRIRGYVNGTAKTYYGSYTTVKVTTAVAPMKNLKVSGVAETSATVSWTKLSGVSGYQVQKLQAGKWVDVNTAVKNTATQFTVSGLAAFSNQQIRVRAYQKDGKNTYYNEWATVGTKTLIGTVTGVGYSNLKADSVRVSWKAAGGAAGYRVFNNGKQIADVKTTYADLRISAGTAYKITVAPYNGSTVGAATAAITFTSPCAKVTGLKVTAVSENTISLSWNAATGAASYQLQYSKNGGAWSSYITVNGASYQAKDLSSNASYTFRVRAVNKNGNTTQYGADSDTASATTKGLGAFTENTVNWQTVDGAQSYEVQYYNSDTYAWETVATGITGTTYSVSEEVYGDGKNLFKVIAYKNGSAVYTSNTASAYISDVDFSFDANKSVVTASWSKYEGATSYEMRIKSKGMTDAGATVIKTTDAKRSATSGRLAHGNVYEVEITAVQGGIITVLASFDIKAKDFAWNDNSDAGKTNQLLYLVEAINRSKFDGTKDEIIVRSTPNVITQVEKIEFGIKGADSGVKKAAVKALLDLLFENPEDKYNGCVIENGFLKCTSPEAIDGLFAEKYADGTIKESMAYNETNPKNNTSRYTFKKGETYSYTLDKVLQPAGNESNFAYLYNSTVDGAWRNGFTSVTTTEKADGTGYIINATLRTEINSSKYHDGFVKGASMTDMSDMGLGSAGTASLSSRVGETTIKAEIDKDCLLTSYEVFSPYEFDMDVEVSLASGQVESGSGSSGDGALNLVMSLFKDIVIGMKTDVKGTQSYKYTFVRSDVA